MNDDGSAGELLLPWRTAALALAGTQYLGSLDLPDGSVNHVFGRGDKMSMFVWNDRPTRELVYLGENCRRVDLWGRSTPLVGDERGQVLDVGPMPVVVTGLNGPLLRLRTSVKLAQTALPQRLRHPARECAHCEKQLQPRRQRQDSAQYSGRLADVAATTLASSWPLARRSISRSR